MSLKISELTHQNNKRNAEEFINMPDHNNVIKHHANIEFFANDDDECEDCLEKG